MKKLAILPLILLLIFPAPTFAQDSPSSATPAGKCEGLERACSAAAKELRAARELIAGYEAHIAAATERIEIAERQIRALKEKGELERDRALELEKIIAAERQAKAVLVKLKEEQSKRLAVV